MAARKTQASRIAELEDRIEELEDHLSDAPHHGDGGRGDDNEQGGQEYVCSLPATPPREFSPDVSPDRERAIIATGNKWVNGTNLRYFMFSDGIFGAGSSQQDVVREAFDLWKSHGIGLNFSEVTDLQDAELRIGFARNDGSWSTVGTDALRRGPQERTMNFGWNIDVPGRNGLDTALHEVGHALGFKHEHQNPSAGIVWNREAVYEYFARTQNPPWSRATTDFNILDTIDPATVDGTDWDPNSITHYQLAAGLINLPVRFRNGLTPAPGLSDKDIEVLRRFYPDTSTAMDPQLKPSRSERLTLSPGDQANFNVLPQHSREYTFSTFGRSDTVMVLFEEVDGEFIYVKGDDDSGWDRNARFTVRLVAGRKYKLRLRLYYSWAEGESVVMMW